MEAAGSQPGGATQEPPHGGIDLAATKPLSPSQRRQLPPRHPNTDCVDGGGHDTGVAGSSDSDDEPAAASPRVAGSAEPLPLPPRPKLQPGATVGDLSSLAAQPKRAAEGVDVCDESLADILGTMEVPGTGSGTKPATTRDVPGAAATQATGRASSEGGTWVPDAPSVVAGGSVAESGRMSSARGSPVDTLASARSERRGDTSGVAAVAVGADMSDDSDEDDVDVDEHDRVVRPTVPPEDDDDADDYECVASRGPGAGGYR